jgi:uncharacterized protein YdeI (YjbR/CyaY-like superfamily)
LTIDETAPLGSEMNPIFFASQAEFMAWLEEHHELRQELWVGFHKKATGRPSPTWPESVDAALCFGWIDGIRKAIDGERYKQRFTPRRKGSNWSAINVRRIQEMREQGLVRPAGIAAFEAALPDRVAVYSHEQRQNAGLDEAFEQQFREDAAAWEQFQSRPDWYRKAAIHWVTSAKREETRRKRLKTLIADSAAGREIAPLARRRALTP